MTFSKLSLLLALLGAVACGPSFQVTTPNGFLELPEPGQYDYRATTADGLVLAAREISNSGEGSLEFWSRAVENQLRLNEGYALLESRSIRSKDQVPGVELRFGHDFGAKPHLYYVALFVKPSKLYLVEVGGTKELVLKSASAIEQALTQFTVN